MPIITDDPVGIILKAVNFSAYKHRHQRRKDIDATPYINHPLALAILLKEEALIDDLAVLCSAILHDTLEDTDTSVEELTREFGLEISAIVQEVTDDKNLNRAERKAQQIANAPIKSYKARLVKVADKISNLRDIFSSPPALWNNEQKIEYCNWSKMVVENMKGLPLVLTNIFADTYQKNINKYTSQSDN